MNWISKLERKFGKHTIQNLPAVIAGAYVVGLLITYMMPGFYASYLCLDAGMILKGQIWRIVTFVIQPPTTNIFFFIFAVYLYYMIGDALVKTWGAFRFNLYYISGMLFHVAGALIAYWITYAVTGTGISFHMGADYLNLSLFFAFAALFPDVQLLLFFILPIKIKWLAYIDGGFFIYTIITGFLPSSDIGSKGVAIAALISLLNFAIYFLSSRNVQKYSPKQRKRRREYEHEIRQFTPKGGNSGNARHRCEVCGRTDVSDPGLEFRYCSKCEGAHEYCMDHIYTHTHIHYNSTGNQNG